MKLLVITPTLGTGPFIETAVDSVAAWPVRHRLVCPPTQQGALAGRFPRLEIAADAGAGLYAALNRGLRELPGEWDAFTWLNDDDLLLGPGFGRLLEEFARRPEVDVAYGRVGLIDARGKNLGALPVARRGSDLPALLARGIVPLAQPGTVIRRSLVERLGGFDEAFRSAGDLDFFVRALAAGARFEFVAARVASFRLHAGQLSKRRAEVEAETVRALRPLARMPRSLAAFLRFRFGNAGVYCDRVRRHGFVSMGKLYDRTD